MTFQRGDRVMIANVAWDVYALARSVVYVTPPGRPSCAPMKFAITEVMYVWRDETWVEVTSGQPA